MQDILLQDLQRPSNSPIAVNVSNDCSHNIDDETLKIHNQIELSGRIDAENR